jgi:FkbM family methyltransferase
MADHVIAVEPHPLLAPILRRNLQENAVATFSTIHCAVGAAPTTGEITRPPGYTDNIGGTQIRMLAPSTPQQSETTVAVQTLDNLMAERRTELRGRPITLLKMDVEGMELDALRGAVNLLREHHPHIVVELATENSRADVRTFLAQFGYRDSGLRFGFTPTYHFLIPGLHELRPETPHRRDAFVDMLIDITDKLETLIPQGARYILADLDEWAEGLPLDGRRQVPFIETDGSYDGPPGTDEDALGELHRQIAAGAEFLVLGSPAFWMLETFPGFAEQLKAFGPPLHVDVNMRVYDLRRDRV